MEHFDLILKNGTVVTSSQERADIGCQNGRIVVIGDLGQAEATAVIDCTGLHVLPGVILREPGNPSVETIHDGTKGAILGDVPPLFVSTQKESSRFLWLGVGGMTSVSGACPRDTCLAT